MSISNNSNTALLGNLNSEYLNFKNEIMSSLNKDSSNSQLSLYIKFADRFFSYIPEFYVNEYNIEEFISLSQNAFNFFQKKHLEFPSVEINIIDGRSHIFILNKNMPFIVDSLMSLLQTHKLEQSLLFHPVIYCDRDLEGNLEHIEDEVDVNSGESLVLIVLDKNLDIELQTNLKSSILELLDTVKITCNSWDQILNKIDDLKSSIREIHSQNQGDIINFLDWLKTHHKIDSASQNSDNIDGQNEEIINFLDWLQNHNFTFLGMIEYDQVNNIQSLIGSRSSWREEDSQIDDIIKYSKQGVNAEKSLIFGTVNTLSKIHRNRVISYILVKKFDLNRKYIGGALLLGLYGSGLQYQSIENIPILKYKLDQIINRSGFSKNGYNVKKIKLIIESLPREPLFEIDQDDLYNMSMHILSAMATKNLKLFAYDNLSKQYLNLFIFLPSDRMIPVTHMKILNYFIDKLKCTIIGDNVKEIIEGYSYLRITVKMSKPQKNNVNYENFEEDLENISKLWKDALRKEISKDQNLKYPKSQLKEYIGIFPHNYQNRFCEKTGLADLQYLMNLLEHKNNIFKLINNDKTSYILKIYSAEEIKLSSIMPIIESIGFKVIDEQKFDISNISDNKFQICVFSLEGPEIKPESVLNSCIQVEEALVKMENGTMVKDELSKLILYSGFTWRQVLVIKSMTSYLRQIGFIYDYSDIKDSLIKHSVFTKNLFNLFDVKLNPDNLEDSSKTIKNHLSKYLSSVVNASEDKILRSMLSIIDSIVRTNYYQMIDGRHKDYISFKLDSHKVLDMPLPRPLVEIFVYSNDFEAIHLRGGRVARGGIRWSDRGADYRTEVLGLMKAQTTKNTVIVPVGSKGGFFVKKDLSGLDKSSFMKEIVNCYKNFLRGLLDITDNIIDKQIILAQNTKILDEPDPYLVVAADKGTASFSDFANSVSKEYNFWLDDAFASGGSDGYDHKKLAITAKGAWIAVARHFMEMGIDVQKDPTSMVGIGDMSGDVFGNGLLRSEKVKLVAAFNHKHIFIDPNPDSQVSFKERQRLFDLPASNWSDYNSDLISKGGGVFERSLKSINLSKEAKAILDIDSDNISPEELIRHILKARIDLIFNGGIGTYIKSTLETHADIGDKANDNLRINGNEIRAKIVGEGGNIGVSQLGRIEYSKIGGRINTDFIDNSAGVGCSDSEVNIKIALSEAIKSGKITLEERNALLKKMTDQVAARVLQANIDQTLALTIFEKSNAFTLEMFSKLINHLEQNHGLDRKLEFLPSSRELMVRDKNGEKLTRPELCVLLAYSKISVSRQLEETNFADDPYLEKYLIEYFPKEMRGEFLDEILSHQLRKQIINTIVTNKIINQLTGTVVNIIQEQTGANIVDIVKYYIVILSIFKIDEIWDEIESLPASFSIDTKINMLTEINKLMRRGIVWFIVNNKNQYSIAELIAEYEAQVNELSLIVGKSLHGSAKEKYNSKLQKFIDNSINKNLAHKISILDSFISIFDVILIGRSLNVSPNNIAKIYFLVGDKLYLDFLRKSVESLMDNSYWNRLAVQSIKDDIYDMQRTIISLIIKSTNNLTESFDNWLSNNNVGLSSYLNFIENMQTQESYDINMVILASKKFRNLLRIVD